MKNNNHCSRKFLSTLLFATTSSFVLWTLPKFRKIGNTLCTFLALAVMCIMLTGCFTGQHQDETSQDKTYQDKISQDNKRILVQYHKGLSSIKSKMSIERHHGRIIRQLRKIKTHVVEISADKNVAEVIENLSKDPLVKFVEEDKLLPPAEEIFPNDPYYYAAWHLEKINAPSAWETSKGEGVIVAVLDTGVDENHPDLLGQTVPGWNTYDNNADSSDIHGHGTKVAGVVAAASDNAIGVTSIAWNAHIMPIRISRPDSYAYVSDIAEGIAWAADNNAQVANISYDVSGSLTVQNAAAYMQEHGGVVVVAAGNSGKERNFVPSTALITVGATSRTDIRAGFSSYGKYLDLVAPGVVIFTTRLGDRYSGSSGTSFASPVVAAVAALMISVNPDLDPIQIDTILKETADDLGEVGNDIYYGAGRVNAAAAVLAAQESPDDKDVEAPTITIVSPVAGIVSGIIPINVNATDNFAVTRVEFHINGELAGTETNEPFTFNWDSTTVLDGAVTLTAYAYDAAENQGISSPVTLNVKNVPDPPEICGDLDEDRDVDYDDYRVFFGTYGLRAGDSGYVEKADSDGDEWITLVDFSAWYRCYKDYRK